MNFPAPGATGQRIMLWIGIIMITIFGVCQMFLLELWPAPGPLISDQELVDAVAASNTKYRFGVVAMLLSGGFFVPMGLTISIQMARVEKGFPYLAIIQFATAVAGCWVFLAGVLFFGLAAFNVDRSPDLIRAFHEMAWLWLLTPGGIYLFQIFSIALVAFIGKQDDPHTAFPRWYGWMTFMFAVESVFPVTFAQMFVDGPLAWDGLVTYYLTMILFAIWVGITMFMCFRAIRLQESAAAKLQ